MSERRREAEIEDGDQLSSGSVSEIQDVIHEMGLDQRRAHV